MCSTTEESCVRRNQHPEQCLTAEEMRAPPASMLSEHYDRPAGGPNLEGRAKKRTPQETAVEVLQLLPRLLAEDPTRTGKAGWCLATQELLSVMYRMKQLSIQVFRQACLNNGDVMSSQIDESQPGTENGWGLVLYEDRRGAIYMCIIEVMYYIRASAKSAGMKGFDPALCLAHSSPYPDVASPHRALRLAVGRLWLATSSLTSKGALGCRDAFDPTSGLPPDMVGVENMSRTGPIVQGSARQVLARRTPYRYYGTCGVHVADLCCQVGPTVALPGDPMQCFLVCSKKSGKS